MADSMKKNYKISGSGILMINDDGISILCEDKGEFDLSVVLADLDERPIKFSFSYDEDYESSVEVDSDTGEII